MARLLSIVFVIEYDVCVLVFFIFTFLFSIRIPSVTMQSRLPSISGCRCEAEAILIEKMKLKAMVGDREVGQRISPFGSRQMAP